MSEQQTFSVGEVAIVLVGCDCGRQCFGAGDEVTVRLPLMPRLIYTGRGSVLIDCYIVERHGHDFAAMPQVLRKRRPPQDWTKLCNLDGVPKSNAEAIEQAIKAVRELNEALSKVPA